MQYVTPATSVSTDKLIVALDVPDAASARTLISTLGEAVTFYKIGLQLFLAEGPSLVREVASRGKHVFLDLKLHDIPNTVAGAIRSLGDLPIRMLTIHASGGIDMLRAAVKAAAELPSRPMILAVTVLTSLDDQDLADTGISGGTTQQVVRLAKLAQFAGCKGLVVSPNEVSAVRSLLGPQTTIVCPGVRPAGTDSGDQRRIATPQEAFHAGATHIVVGRPIIAASDPATAALALLEAVR
jgi:orotidine-5'-phosphate decarboxylase